MASEAVDAFLQDLADHPYAYRRASGAGHYAESVFPATSNVAYALAASAAINTSGDH